MGHFAIRMGLMVRAAEAALRPAVRDIEGDHQTSRASTGQTAAVPWRSRAGEHPVSGAPSRAPSERARGDASRTTKSALKWRAVKRTNGHFWRA